MLPLRRVLAAVDFSDASRVALTFAARLAKHTNAELRVLHAEDPTLAAAAAAAGIDLAKETREELERFMQSAALAGDWAPIHHVVTGSAVDAICDIGSREDAGVIVVGARGMSGAERRMFGSTTEGVLRNADRSILVVPSEWGPPRLHESGLSGMGPIIAAVDMSAGALEAAGVAFGLADILGTSVEAVHVVARLPVLERWSVHADAAIQEREATARRELTERLRAARPNGSIDLHVETGPVAECLAAASTRHGAHPLLVMGRRTRTDRKGAPGGTAYRVLALADVPLLVHVPAAA